MRLYLYIYLFFLACSFWLSGCHTENEAYTATLTASGKLTFPLDSLTPNYTIPEGCSYRLLNGIPTLTYFNRLNYTLVFFDVKKKEEYHRIQLKKQGMYPVNHIVGMEVISRDSILLLPMYIKRLYLLNWQGDIYRVYNLAKEASLDRMWKNEPARQLDFVDQECIMGTTPLADQNQPNQYYRIPLGAAYDLKTEKLNVNFIEYPPLYQNKTNFGFYHAQSSYCINDKGHIVVSFPADPNLYLYDRSKRFTGKVSAECSQFSGKVSAFTHAGEEEKYYFNEDGYESVYYDKYRNVYYRFATAGIDGKLPVSSNALYKGLFKPVYIIILDEKLNKIGEILLPENKHYFLNTFINEDGLYLSDSHPENPEMKENKLSFTCYKLVRH